MSSAHVQPIQSIFASKVASPSYNTHPVARPRPVLSCLRCRRRKVKCNRDLPCKQCISTGHTEDCSYTTRPKTVARNRVQNPNGSSSQPISTATAAIIVPDIDGHSNAVNIESDEFPKAESLASIQLRLQKLERLCANHGIATSDDGNDEEELIHNLPKPDASLSIKTSGARYHSQSYKKSLFHHFRGPGRFMLSGFNDPERVGAWTELRRYYERLTKARRKRDKREQASWTLSPLLDLLPSREICSEAVNSYFKSFEKTMRILHYPSFMSEFQRFWDSDEAQRDEFKFFILQVAIIVAIIYAWEGVSNPGGEKELKADILCGHVGEWLETLRGRKQLTMGTLQTRALLILSQQVRSVQPDEIWRSTGNLLRSAMVAGLHRDPSEFPDIKIFEGELRRRLWMTILELDLGASLIYGMPTMIHEGDFTCKLPTNVNDVELFDGMKELPLSKSLSESTDSILQVSLLKTLPIRLQAISGTFTRVEDVQPLIHTLEKQVQQLPAILNLNRGSKDDLRRILGIILLYVHIQRFLSHLHHAYITLTDLAPETVNIGVQSSLAVLSYQKLLETQDPRSENNTGGNCWELFHILCKNDIMQAALDICLHAQAPGLVSWTRASLLLAIDDTIANLMQRISRNGNDIKDVLRLSVISQMLKAQAEGRNTEEMMKEGAYNVLMACRKAARLDETHNGDEAEKHDPNTQLVSENGNTIIDWTSMPTDPLLVNHDMGSYLDMGGANYDLLEGYTIGGSSSQSDLWSQY